MGRPRNPKRDEARKKYLESGGQISTKDLAAAAGVPENRIRKWKSEDKWNEELKNRPKKRGGQPGNQNAAGKTPAKNGNKNAVTHGAFAQVGIEDMAGSGTDLHNKPVIHNRQQDTDKGRPGGNPGNNQILAGNGHKTGKPGEAWQQECRIHDYVP